MNVFRAVNWAEINENNRMLTVSNDCSQLFERQGVFGGSRESQLPRGINRQKRVSTIRRAIASLAQAGFGCLRRSFLRPFADKPARKSSEFPAYGTGASMASRFSS